MRSQRAHSNLRSALLLLVALSALALLCPSSAHAGTPCCSITAIDARSGVVTARVTASGQTFQFNAGSALRQLRVGQSIYANLATKQVSVNGLQPCCSIIKVGVASVDGVLSPAQSTALGSTAASSAAGSTLGAQAAKGAVNPGTPCCQITAIDSSTGVVTGLVTATGQTFQFNAGSMLSQLHAGQNIYANLATKQVSVNGLQPCCNIINVGVAQVDGVRSPAQSTAVGSSATSSAAGNTLGAQAAKGAVNPGAPCCDITGINSSTGVVTAQVRATGQSFQFNMNNAAQLHSLQVGQGLYANFKSNHVSLDGKHSSGRIVSSGAAAASQSTTSSQTGSTQPSGGSDQPKSARVNGSGVGRPTVFGGNETLEGATKKCQASCDAEGQQHNPPMACRADVAQTNPGQYSCTCKCDQVGGGDGGKTGGVTVSGGPTVENTLSAPAPANNAQNSKPIPVITMANTRSIDPCSLASTAQLQSYAASGIAAVVPKPYDHDGEKVSITDPQLSSLTCSPLHIEVTAKIHYKKTRGFPQGSASGHLKFGSPVIARIVSTAAPSAAVTSSNFQSAALCLTDITIDELNLANVPNWIDNTWVRNYLNQQFGGSQNCNDVTQLVATFLQSGGTIPPGVTTAINSQSISTVPTIGTVPRSPQRQSTNVDQPTTAGSNSPRIASVATHQNTGFQLCCHVSDITQVLGSQGPNTYAGVINTGFSLPCATAQTSQPSVQSSRTSGHPVAPCPTSWGFIFQATPYGAKTAPGAVGTPLYVDFGTREVSLDGVKPLFTIISGEHVQYKEVLYLDVLPIGVVYDPPGDPGFDVAQNCTTTTPPPYCAPYPSDVKPVSYTAPQQSFAVTKQNQTSYQTTVAIMADGQKWTFGLKSPISETFIKNNATTNTTQQQQQWTHMLMDTTTAIGAYPGLNDVIVYFVNPTYDVTYDGSTIYAPGLAPVPLTKKHVLSVSPHVQQPKEQSYCPDPNVSPCQWILATPTVQEIKTHANPSFLNQIIPAPPNAPVPVHIASKGPLGEPEAADRPAPAVGLGKTGDCELGKGLSNVLSKLPAPDVRLIQFDPMMVLQSNGPKPDAVCPHRFQPIGLPNPGDNYSLYPQTDGWTYCSNPPPHKFQAQTTQQQTSTNQTQTKFISSISFGADIVAFGTAAGLQTLPGTSESLTFEEDWETDYTVQYSSQQTITVNATGNWGSGYWYYGQDPNYPNDPGRFYDCQNVPQFQSETYYDWANDTVLFWTQQFSSGSPEAAKAVTGTVSGGNLASAYRIAFNVNGGKGRIAVPIDSSGHFHAFLLPGEYSYRLEDGSGRVLRNPPLHLTVPANESRSLVLSPITLRDSVLGNNFGN